VDSDGVCIRGLYLMIMLVDDSKRESNLFTALEFEQAIFYCCRM